MQVTLGTDIGATALCDIRLFVVEKTNGTFLIGVIGSTFTPFLSGSQLSVSNQFANGLVVPFAIVVQTKALD